MSLTEAIKTHNTATYKRMKDISFETGLIYTDLVMVFENHLIDLETKYFSNPKFKQESIHKESRLILEAYNSMLQTLNIKEEKYNKQKHYSLKPQDVKN